MKFEARLRGEVERVRVRLWRWSGGWRTDPGSSASTACFLGFVSTERDMALDDAHRPCSTRVPTTRSSTERDQRFGDVARALRQSLRRRHGRARPHVGPVLDDATGIWHHIDRESQRGFDPLRREGRWDQSAGRGWVLARTVNAHGAVVSGTSYTAEDRAHVDAIGLTYRRCDGQTTGGTHATYAGLDTYGSSAC